MTLSIFCTCLSAQTDAPRHELGIQFSGINFDGSNTFNAFYKKEIRPAVWRRVRVVFGNARIQNQGEQTSSNFNAGINRGREKRRSLAERLTFYHGFQFGLNAGFSANEEDFNWFTSPSIGYVLGLQHDFNAQ